MEAWALARRNGGQPGVDGESFADIDAYGVERWVGELSRVLRDGTYAPQPVRQVLIPKKQPGKFRPLGIPTIRDRVAQTSAMLVRTPIFEADLQPEQNGYRPERSALDAVKRIHRLLNRGHNEVVDGDLSNYFGEIPHAELMMSVARRVSDGKVLGLIKAWLEMAVEEDDGKGGKRRTNRARRERKGTPQGSPISPLLSERSHIRCSVTSTCGASYWVGSDWVTLGASVRRSSAMPTTSVCFARLRQRICWRRSCGSWEG